MGLLNSYVPSMRERDELTPHTLGPIEKGAEKAIVAEVEQFLSDQHRETALIQDIERSIRQTVPDFEAQDQAWGNPHWRTSPGIRLRPEEATDYFQRRFSFECQDDLRYYVKEARRKQTPLSPQAITDHYNQYREAARAHYQEFFEDFSLENVFGTTKRLLYYWYGQKDEGEDKQEIYQDTLTLNRLLDQALQMDTDSTAPSQSASSGK